MSAATTAALRRKAQSYFRDAQVFADMHPTDEGVAGLTSEQWRVVCKAVATELHKVADEIQAGEDS